MMTKSNWGVAYPGRNGRRSIIFQLMFSDYFLKYINVKLEYSHTSNFRRLRSITTFFVIVTKINNQFVAKMGLSYFEFYSKHILYSEAEICSI